MTELNMLYGGNDDNLLNDNLDSAYSSQKLNKLSTNDMSLYGEEKTTKSQYNPNISLASHVQGPGVSSNNNSQIQQPVQLQQQHIQVPQIQHSHNQPSVPQYYLNSNYDNQSKNYNSMDNSHYTAANDNYRKKGNEYNFFDRMSMKKTEVVKLALFSLVIVLGISIDRMITYYLSKYIGDNILTDFQELLLRLSYPIAIFLLLWIFKAL
jgi:hypothetical protein